MNSDLEKLATSKSTTSERGTFYMAVFEATTTHVSEYTSPTKDPRSYEKNTVVFAVKRENKSSNQSEKDSHDRPLSPDKLYFLFKTVIFHSHFFI